MNKEANRIRTIINILLDHFLRGLLFTVPLGLTIFFIYKLFWFIDDIVQQYIIHIMPFRIPGLGLIIMFVVITLAGIFGQSILSKPINSFIEKMIKKAPLIQLIYTSIKDFVSAFLSKEKKFNQPVLVKINHISNLEKIGFITQRDLSFLNIEGKVAVYFPHSYNFSGELFLVPSNDITPLDISASTAMKFIVSGGVSNINNEI